MLTLVFFVISLLVSVYSSSSVLTRLNSTSKRVETQQFSTSYNNGIFTINGYEPIDNTGSTYPLYIWVQGTVMLTWGQDCRAYAEYMASNEQSFVGVSLDYNNGLYPSSCADFETKASLMFNISNPQSAISVLCAKSNVDCNKGIVLSGFSQGANLVSLSGNYGADNYIKGIYEIGGGDMTSSGTGYPCLQIDSLTIDNSRIRSMAGENDEYFGNNFVGVQKEQIAITGLSGSDCNSEANCIQSNGNGWYIVTTSETASGSASHCYTYTNSACVIPSFDSNYYPNCPNCQWSLQSNYQWLIDKVYN